MKKRPMRAAERIRDFMTEHSNIYRSEDGTEVEIRIKAECQTDDDMRKSLGFMAQCSHKFYLEAAEKFKGGHET